MLDGDFGAEQVGQIGVSRVLRHTHADQRVHRERLCVCVYESTHELACAGRPSYLPCCQEVRTHTIKARLQAQAVEGVPQPRVCVHVCQATWEGTRSASLWDSTGSNPP